MDSPIPRDIRAPDDEVIRLGTFGESNVPLGSRADGEDRPKAIRKVAGTDIDQAVGGEG